MSAAVDVTPTAASKNSANHITTSDADPAIPRTNAVVAGSDDPAAGSHTLEALSHDLRRRVDAFLDLDTDDAVLRSTQNQVRVARDVIDEALRRYRPEELSLSYNGGKDCLVLLVLILASLPSHFPPSSASASASTSAPSVSNARTSKPTDQSASSSPSATATATRPFPTSFQALYIRPPSPFPEVDAFVASSTADYHLDLATSDLPMKPALTEYLHDTSISQSKSHPQSQSQSKTEVNGDGKQGRGVKAVFVGTRRTDPHGALLTHFDETDADWPRFMRIHPVIDWHYREVWRFIRALDIPYCPLYDMGYTSLGGTNDTHPNPALRRSEKQIAEGRSAFRPAYELMEDDEERLGRDR